MWQTLEHSTQKLMASEESSEIGTHIDENKKSFRKHEPEIVNLKSRHQEIDEILMV